jgi:hypothetical protein
MYKLKKAYNKAMYSRNIKITRWKKMEFSCIEIDCMFLILKN